MLKTSSRKGILVLFATAAMGLLSVWFFQQQASKPINATKDELTFDGIGSGMSGADFGSGMSGTDFGCSAHFPTLDADKASVPPTALVTSPLKVTSKPRAEYTDEARSDDVQGTVRLKITLMADGHVGNITPLNELPDGLTERAIAAARQIKFEPRKVNGVPQSSVVTFEYSFTIY